MQDANHDLNGNDLPHAFFMFMLWILGAILLFTAINRFDAAVKVAKALTPKIRAVEIAMLKEQLSALERKYGKDVAA